MNKIQRVTYGLLTAWFIAPLAAAQNECGDAVIVSSGDTLSKIAERCDTTVNALLDANRQLDDGNSVAAGSILAMPGTGAVSYSTAQPSSAEDAAEVLAAEEIDELVAPIALYPDVLLSEILPASTYPVEIVQAARWHKTHKNADDADKQNWAPSIKALTRYPDALNMLNDDLDWSVRLGDAFLAQPDDVFDGIQRMRTRAEAAGNLKDTEQQVIVREKTEVVEVIRIVPANPRYVYVPYYDPYAVYYPHHGARVVHHAPLISFSTGFALGGWMNYGLNWRHRHIYHHDYAPSHYRGQRQRTITRVNNRYAATASGQRWRHNVNRSRRHHDRAISRTTLGTSQRNHVSTRRDANQQRVNANTRHEARVNRLKNRRHSEHNRQTLNRSGAQQVQQPQPAAAAVRAPQTHSARIDRTTNTNRRELRRNRRDHNPQQRIQRQLNQRQRSVARTQTPQSTRAAVNRASNHTQRRTAQPTASAPPRNSVRVSRPQAPTTNSRSESSQRNQQSIPVRASSNRSERNTRSHSRDRGESRSRRRPGRTHEQRR